MQDLAILKLFGYFFFLFTTDTSYRGARAPKKRAQHVKFRPRNEHFKIKEITFSKCSKNIVFEQNPHISTSFQYFFLILVLQGQ